MTRGGRTKDSDVSERRCIATGETGPKAGLFRFVVGPDNIIFPDMAEKLPGRGIWVSANAAALEKAARKGLFSRAAKQAVTVPDDLPQTVARLAMERSVATLSLARKAGLAFAGQGKVKEALITEVAVCLLQANDGSVRERSRLRPPEGENTFFDTLNAGELGLAFGRDRVIHAALIAGGLSDRVRYELARLTGLRGADQG